MPRGRRPLPPTVATPPVPVMLPLPPVAPAPPLFPVFDCSPTTHDWRRSQQCEDCPHQARARGAHSMVNRWTLMVMYYFRPGQSGANAHINKFIGTGQPKGQRNEPKCLPGWILFGSDGTDNLGAAAHMVASLSPKIDWDGSAQFYCRFTRDCRSRAIAAGAQGGCAVRSLRRSHGYGSP